MSRILLKNCYYILKSVHEEALRGYDMLIEDNRVAKIDKNIDFARSGDDRVIDCSTHVIVPGFVNTHHHFYQTLTRNLPAVQDAKLFDWLVYLYEIWKNLDEDAIYYSSQLAMGELLKTGCTTSTDHHYVYPYSVKDDIMGLQFKAAEDVGVEVIYAPEASSIYSEGFQTRVAVKNLTAGLCGASRPGHFDGVITVVAKLFNTVKPKIAVFGQKDFQQLAVIKSMVRDLDWDIEIVTHPIVREKDGLAMSSRNRYLSAEERKSALCLSGSLDFVRHQVGLGELDCHRLLGNIKERIGADPMVEIDYLTVVDHINLREQDKVDSSSVFAMAVKIGETRLIDNGYLLK